MSSEEIKELVRKQFEYSNQRDMDGFFKNVSPKFVDHGLRPEMGLGSGLEGTRNFLKMQFEAFPDARVTLEDVIVEGDKAVTRASVHGTNQGSFMGMPATGKAASWEFIDIYRLENGKFAEHWVQMDTAPLMQQLGLAPQQPRR